MMSSVDVVGKETKIVEKMDEVEEKEKKRTKMSLLSYFSSEVTRGYQLEHDEERYRIRRQKMYTFMKIPRELEKFMSYGFFHCLDTFLFVFTFLPLRFIRAVFSLCWRFPLISIGLMRPYHGRSLYPAEIIDLLKGLIITVCVTVMSYIDTSVMYHIIKSQSVIKLYLFYNMLEVGDRLFSAFGQDTIDALFWTATEPKNRKRETIGVIPHFLLAVTYVFLHTLLVLFQATTLNVAINASNKALLTIMMSNNFVELKGSVFKKFDKNNLFQVSCSDVRERFHLFALLFVVVVQTMKEYGWKEESFWSLTPDCILVLSAEFLVDWIKHAFITRFNEVSAEVYKDYTTSLAYDLAQTKQKHAFSDHSDLVSRRMGFIPLPLGVVMIRVIGSAVKMSSPGAPLVFLLAYLCLLTFRVLSSIVILGKACDLIDQHQKAKTSSSSGRDESSKTEKEEDVFGKEEEEESTTTTANSSAAEEKRVVVVESLTSSANLVTSDSDFMSNVMSQAVLAPEVRGNDSESDDGNATVTEDQRPQAEAASDDDDDERGRVRKDVSFKMSSSGDDDDEVAQEEEDEREDRDSTSQQQQQQLPDLLASASSSPSNNAPSTPKASEDAETAGANVPSSPPSVNSSSVNTSEASSPFRARSLSSPDFMKKNRSRDSELDWPEVEGEEEEDVILAEDEGQQVRVLLSCSRIPQRQSEFDQFEDDFEIRRRRTKSSSGGEHHHQGGGGGTTSS